MAITSLSLFIYFNIAYILGRVKSDFSILDVFWGPSFFLIFISSYLQNPTTSIRVVLVGFLVLLWSLRLAWYIYQRSQKLGKEDYRYASWREDWKGSVNIMFYFKVYMLQMILSFAVGYPLFILNKVAVHHDFGTLWDIIGLVLWIVGFLFEAVGDYQKDKFKSNPENNNKVLKSGLWRYTRHPNYFGESFLWWGVFFILINDLLLYQIIFAPVLLTFLLLKVSGVSMLEKKYKKNDEYALYKQQTNAFIPWFPKGEQS